jgi:hypothetical protein
MIDSYQEAITQANQLNKTAVFDALASAGITELAVTFDGWGDSGQLQGMEAHTGSTVTAIPAVNVSIHEYSYGGARPLIHVVKTLIEAVEELCYGYLNELHYGWEIDDGSFGDFCFDVANRTIRLEYNGRITDVITECDEF